MMIEILPGCHINLWIRLRPSKSLNFTDEGMRQEVLSVRLAADMKRIFDAA
jgi:hypothetical protein